VRPEFVSRSWGKNIGRRHSIESAKGYTAAADPPPLTSWLTRRGVATMRPPIPPEVALWAFFEEHRRSGDLDAGVEDERLWMTCECGAQVAHPVSGKR
jgi:hypothetical protein